MEKAPKPAASNAPTLPYVGSAPTLPADSQPAQVDPSPAPLDELPFAERYRIRALLGAGGMGEVHVGRDERIGREVAIKVARAGSGSQPDAMARFLSEARVQGQLEHPSIVPVYDLGRRADGAAFFTMKRVRGLTLEQILDGLRKGDAELEQRYSRRKLLAAFSNVCLAIHFAHTRGVLHRDLKPGNVMLGDFGEVYVLDWGLAKLAGADEAPAQGGEAETTPHEKIDSGPAGATTSGAVMGTPGYMPPEQVRGQIDRMDARVDVYSLGAVLFELLTLEPLHPRGTAAEVMSSTIFGADARASVRAPGRDVPPELEAICVRATAIAPADRFASAREMHEAIERFLDGDRDLERRRQLAEELSARAAQAAERALACGSDDDRREALQQAGRALALDPSHAGAVGTMVKLLLEPPCTMPAEVKQELEQARDRSMRVASRVAGVGYLIWLTFIPMFLAMGPKQIAPLIVWGISCAALAALSLLGPRSPLPMRRLHPIALTLGCLTLVLGTPFFGPYTVLPGFIVATIMGFAMSGRREYMRGYVIAGMVTAVLPIIAEWTGLLPVTTTFEGGALRVSSWAVEYPPMLTTVVLALSSLSLVIVPAIFTARVRGALDRAEERLLLQSWHLRQLVPDQAHGALAAPPEPTPSCPFDEIRPAVSG